MMPGIAPALMLSDLRGLLGRDPSHLTGHDVAISNAEILRVEDGST